MNEQIFVSIASYRDPECQHTVADLFAKAAHPERISVGICWQVDPELDKDCFLVPPPYPSRVRSRTYTLAQSKGGCWARAEAHSLLQDEDYVLQIDAHMRFAQHWDSSMIEACTSIPGECTMLTGSPLAYVPPDKLDVVEGKRRLISAHELGDDDDPQLLHLGNIHWQLKDVPATAMPTPFFVGNFLFMPSQALREVPYDPYIYFRGQELAYSARLWTHGWNLWQPKENLIYHYWKHKSRAHGTDADYKKKNALSALGKARVLHLLRGIPAPAEALIEIEKYGMGTARPLQDYWKHADIDLETRTIGWNANKGRWDKNVI